MEAENLTKRFEKYATEITDTNKHISGMYQDHCDEFEIYDDEFENDKEDNRVRTSFEVILNMFEPVLMGLGSVAKTGEALGISYFPDWEKNGYGMLAKMMNRYGYKSQEAYTVYRSVEGLHGFGQVNQEDSTRIRVIDVAANESTHITINTETAEQCRRLLKIEPSFYETGEYVILLLKDQIALHVVLDDDYKYQIVARI